MIKVALGKVAKIDRTVATDNECKTLPYVGLEHIEKEAGNFEPDYKPEALDMLATNFKFTSKHVLYGKLRPYLNKVALPNFDGVCTTEILPILPDEKQLDRIYLWSILISSEFVAWATAQISGANLPRLDPKLLAEYPIPLPPLPEQRRIADLLSRADRLRRLRRVGDELSDSLLQSVFLEMFGNPKTNSKHWQVVKFNDVCELRLGKMLDDKQQTGKHLRPYLRNINVQWANIDLTDVAQMDFDQKDREEFRLKYGDILICEGGEVGRSAIWRDEMPECYFQKALHRARPNPKLAIPEYIIWLMFMMAQTGGLGDFTSQVTIAHLTGEKLKELVIPIPPLPEQEEFAAVVRRVEVLAGAGGRVRAARGGFVSEFVE